MQPDARDAELLSLAKEGDRAALESLLEMHHQQLYRFGLRMCGNPEDAADVLQNTLLAASQNLAEFRGDAALSTWLYTIARRYCGRRQRHEKKRGSTIALEDVATDELQSLSAQSPSPEATVEGNELKKALEGAIQSLSPELKEVLVLRDVQGLSNEEAAAVLGLTVESTKSRLHRARLTVRKLLRPEFRPSSEPRSSSSGCPDIAELYSKHLEGDIPPAICLQMEKHVASCTSCSAVCAEVRSTLALCETQLRHEPVPREITENVRKTLDSRVR